MQNRRGLIFLGLAVAMGLAAAWITSEFSSKNPAATDRAVAKTTAVVVVRSDVPVASSLTDAQLKLVDWPSEHVPSGTLLSIDSAKGRIVRRPLAQGEPVLETSLYPVGASGGLGAVIADNYRAVSVKVDNVIGVAGFVVPGSRVDVMATLRRVDWDKAIPFSKVILQDVRVLAVDQKLEEVKTGTPELVSVVTLEVEPKQAERLIYAAHEGRLQLALRTPGDDKNVTTERVGVVDVLEENLPVKASPKQPVVASVRSRVNIVRGTDVEVKKF